MQEKYGIHRVKYYCVSRDPLEVWKCVSHGQEGLLNIWSLSHNAHIVLIHDCLFFFMNFGSPEQHDKQTLLPLHSEEM